MQEERGFVQQPFRRFDILDDHAASQRMQLRVFFRGQFASGKDDHGQVLELGIVAQLLQHIEAAHIGQPQIEHHAIVIAFRKRQKRVAAGVDHVDIDVLVAQQFARAELFGRIVFDDQQPLAARLRVLADPREGGIEILGGRRLGDKSECAARQAVMPVFIERKHLHGNVAGRGVLLEMIQHRPAEHVGQEHIERDCGRIDTRAPATSASAPVLRNQDLESLVAREIAEHASIVRIVFDDRAARCRPASRLARSSSIRASCSTAEHGSQECRHAGRCCRSSRLG